MNGLVENDIKMDTIQVTDLVRMSRKQLVLALSAVTILFYYTYGLLRSRDSIQNAVSQIRGNSFKIAVSQIKEDVNMKRYNVCNGDAYIHLFQQLVSLNNVSEIRKIEYLSTFQRNVEHPCVRFIYVLEETWEERNIYKKYINDVTKKVKFIPFGRQPYYRDIFRIVSEYIFPNFNQGDLWMITNADIVLDRGFEKLHNTVNNRTLIVLSRHTKYCKERNMCLNFNGGSMDSFLGSMYIPKNISDSLRFVQNTLGAENEVTYSFLSHGFTAVNPCKSVITIHNHCSNDRPWRSRPGAKKRVDKRQTHVQAQTWLPSA